MKRARFGTLRPQVQSLRAGSPSVAPLDDRHAGSSTARGYGYRWQKARARYLAAHPLCVECRKVGSVVVATVVDHITPHRGDADLFWDESNWQPLCKPHHDLKTGHGG